MMEPPKVLAELGQVPTLLQAMEAVDQCAAAGCWGVKIQMLAPWLIASAGAVKYWEHGDDRSQAEVFLDNGSMTDYEVAILSEYAAEQELAFVVTPFDTSQVIALAEIPHDAVKIASGDITNMELLEAVVEYLPSSPIILSTGAATVAEIQSAARMLEWDDRQDIVLACSLEYPTPNDHAELSRISTLSQTGPGVGWPCKFTVGYSDHTLGRWTAHMLPGLGAVLVEKHFTLKRSKDPASNPDDHMALDQAGMELFVETLSAATRALGTGDLVPHAGEDAAWRGARRSLFAATQINAGELLTRGNLISLRPGPQRERGDVCASEWLAIADNAIANRTIVPGEQIREENITRT
jgi:N,N'-diacetyllegionaminate synthase